MGLFASTSLLLLGSSLALLDRPVVRGRHFFRYVPLLAAVISIVPLVGYTLGLPTLYSQASMTGIAWPTAVTLFLVSIGAVAARPSNRIVELLAARNVGGVFARRLVLPSLVLPVLLVVGYSLVRAQADPYPNAFTYYKGERLRVLRASVSPRLFGGTPGRVTVPEGNGIAVVCGADAWNGGNPALVLERLRLDDGTEVDATDFFAGRAGCLE